MISHADMHKRDAYIHAHTVTWEVFFIVRNAHHSHIVIC